MEWNPLALAILAMLVLLWLLDLIAAILNLKALSPELPGEFADVYDPERYAKSQNYTRESSRFEIMQSTFMLALTIAFWVCGGFFYLDLVARNAVGKMGMESELVVGLLFLAMIYLGTHLIDLPFRIYDTFILEEKYGFNKTTPRTFVMDEIKNLLLTALLGGPLVAGVLWIFTHVPHAWAWGWVLITVMQLLLMWLAPVVILPLFNKFTPMPDGPLRDAIYKMAQKCKFPLMEISVTDGSKRSSKANAYFTGFGKTKKIALFDTLIEEQSQDEIVSVLAHEIGHYRCHHVIQRLVASIIQTAVVFYLLGLTVDPTNRWALDLFHGFGLENVSPHVGLVLFGLLFSPVSRILSVVFNAWSRKHEFEADAYAAKAVGTGEHLISALKKLSARNLSNLTPHPLRVFLDHSHPPTLVRIQALRDLNLSETQP
jgi:STE24 endopeptidase